MEEACCQWRRHVASGGGVWPVKEACGQWRRLVASGGGKQPVTVEEMCGQWGSRVASGDSECRLTPVQLNQPPSPTSFRTQDTAVSSETWIRCR